MRTGDTVLHRPSGERWMVACAHEDRDQVYWMGWPPGCAKISDCDLLLSATDEECRGFLQAIAEIRDSDHRGACAQRTLAALEGTNDMTDDARTANADLAEIARLRAQLGGLRDVLAQRDRALIAAHRAIEIRDVDNGAYVEALQWLYDDWNGPSTEALARARMALAADHPGAALLAELDAARAVIAFVGPNADCPTSALNHELTRLLLAYDAAVKARTE